MCIEGTRDEGEVTEAADFHLMPKNLSVNKTEEVVYLHSTILNELELPGTSGEAPRTSREVPRTLEEVPRTSGEELAPSVEITEAEIDDDKPPTPDEPYDIDDMPLADRHPSQASSQEDSQDIENDEEPTTPEQALREPYANQWRIAMAEELRSLEENDTWDLEPIPKGKKPIGCKWVFKIKTTTNGSANKFKARLVAQGFSQKFGVDYEEVFAPVVKGATIRCVLSIAGKRGYHAVHTDVKTAFLNGKIKEVVYMKQPPGHEDQYHRDWGCRLNKSLYGLRQSAKDWNETLNKMLVNHGFARSDNDPCLYNCMAIPRVQTC